MSERVRGDALKTITTRMGRSSAQPLPCPLCLLPALPAAYLPACLPAVPAAKEREPQQNLRDGEKVEL